MPERPDRSNFEEEKCSHRYLHDWSRLAQAIEFGKQRLGTALNHVANSDTSYRAIGS